MSRMQTVGSVHSLKSVYTPTHTHFLNGGRKHAHTHTQTHSKLLPNYLLLLVTTLLLSLCLSVHLSNQIGEDERERERERDFIKRWLLYKVSAWANNVTR